MIATSPSRIFRSEFGSLRRTNRLEHCTTFSMPVVGNGTRYLGYLPSYFSVFDVPTTGATIDVMPLSLFSLLAFNLVQSHHSISVLQGGVLSLCVCVCVSKEV
mmetsp:Transcript_17905/g.37172  ORF Transcript_17905/g.37172 Transcript_17905/m.37172 type:complete len:103 (-) Transcript_17905:255-563(-)